MSFVDSRHTAYVNIAHRTAFVPPQNSVYLGYDQVLKAFVTHIEIIETFKTKLSPSKVMDSLEKQQVSNGDSGNGSGENDLQEDLKNNP